jgi:hypothetical protein
VKRDNDFLATLRTEEARRCIAIHNGKDDIGVEDFMKEVRPMRNHCIENDLLLKAIEIEKVVGKAAQGIRSIPIKCYEDLYEALRRNAAAQVTTDEYNEQLREIRQERKETVQSFYIRFRRISNKLTYAITKEYPEPTTRRVMIAATMKKVNKIYLKGLGTDLGRFVFFDETISLAEAKKKALELERYLREERNDWKRTAISRQPNYEGDLPTARLPLDRHPLASR